MDTASAGIAGMITFAILVVLIGFAIGAFFALPMIWFHVGHMSRKLSRIIELLEKREK